MKSKITNARCLTLVALMGLQSLAVTSFAHDSKSQGQDTNLFNETKAKAEAGDFLAMNQLAKLYANGQGTTSNPIEATKWFRKSYDHVEDSLSKSFASSQNSQTGWNDQEQRNIFLNYSKNIKRLSDEYNPYARLKHGQNLSLGIRRPNKTNPAYPLYESAAQTFELFANQGSPMAMRQLAKLYSEGLGVNQNESTAKSWYRKAAYKGDTVSIQSLGYLLQYEASKSKSGSPEATELEKETTNIWAIGARLSDPISMHNYGLRKREGRGTSKSIQEGTQWILRAAEAGEKRALQYLVELNPEVPSTNPEATPFYLSLLNEGALKIVIGEMFKAGKHLPQSPENSRKWYSLGSTQLENQKDFEGMLQVAKFYRSNSVARVNESEASKWQSQGLQGMQQQALSGDISQCASLIQQYDSGKYINIDAQQSAKWKKVKLDTLNKKAESGDQSSMMTLANLYRAGMDVPMSEAISLQWLRKLGERGEYEALQRLSTSPLLSPDEKQKWSNQIVSVLNSQAENGSAYARWSLAMHYLQQPGIENKRKSFEWIKVASDRFLLSSFFSSYTLDIRPSFSPEAMQSMYGSVISKEELAQYSNLYIQETEALIESEGLAYSPLYLDMLAKHFESGKFVQKDLQKAQKYQRQYQNYRLELEAEQTRNKNKSN